MWVMLGRSSGLQWLNNSFKRCFTEMASQVSSSTSSSSSPSEFEPRRALILSKISRYQFERNKHPHLSESELSSLLSSRGSNLTLMRKHHEIHQRNFERLRRALENNGLEVAHCQRTEYNDEQVNWADVVFSAGGDGTFLMAASKVNQCNKAVIGLNTDPTRSEGYLCLPKQFSEDPDAAVRQLLSNRFRWLFRRRLRITLSGRRSEVMQPPLELNRQQLVYPEYRYVEMVTEASTTGDHPLKEGVCVERRDAAGKDEDDDQVFHRVLPVLALNEVFLGESLSSRVSYLEVRFDDEEKSVKTRNSGLCLSTGTGSTSWTFNINKLTQQSVQSLLTILQSMQPQAQINSDDSSLVDRLTDAFNREIVFDPEESHMAYTLRDPISQGTFPLMSDRKPRGKVRRVEVKSRCFDACLVIDGSLSFRFNDGAKADIEIRDEDALRTVVLDETS